MLKKRIIPCLDIRGGRTVKGVQFESIRDAGDPVELAKLYSEQGADELVFLDITATYEKRKTLIDLVSRVAKEINIPFTVGGGIESVEDVYEILRSGADKISINSAAVKNPDLINELSQRFGSQCVVAAIDARQEGGQWEVYLNGVRKATGIDLFEWAQDLQNRGAGEILFTAMNNDGMKNGFAVDALRKLNHLLSIPVIASGGAGSQLHFKEVFEDGRADAALAASVFHFGEIKLPELKDYLSQEGVQIRL